MTDLIEVWYRRAVRGRLSHVFADGETEDPLCGYVLDGRRGFSRWYSGDRRRPRNGRICSGCDAEREQREEQANLRARIVADEIEGARA